jgi:hypothetical protein
MAEQVFISHAGPDLPRAKEVALTLEQAEIGVVLDRRVNRPGDDFMHFMEKALTECDYCLLLWSKAAAEREWVQLEWEAALHRAIKEARRFLIAARLEDHPLPTLLAPRLFVEFFPSLHPGIDQFIAMCLEDRAAAKSSGRPVGQATIVVNEDQGGETIYITSELFQRTMPLKVSMDAPSGVFVDRLVSDLKLPRQHDYQGVIGVQYEYKLVYQNHPLARQLSFKSQGIRTNSIVWLEVKMKPFASRPPVEGAITTATFRGGSDQDDAEAHQEARRTLMTALTRAGLGF